MVKEGWRDKEMNISKNAVKKKIFTFRTLTKKKKWKENVSISKCSLKYMFEIIPFLLIFHEQKKRDERYGNIQNRKGVARAEQGQLMMILESLVWIIGKFNENTRR